VLRILLWLPICAAPCVALLWFVWRVPPIRDPARSVWGTYALGMLVAIPSLLAENALARFTGIADQLDRLAGTSSLLFVFLFAAPLEEGLKVAAAWPAFRSGEFDEAFDGILYATAAAAGFATLEGAMTLARHPVSTSEVVRVFLILISQPLLSSMWGYGLGRVRRTKTPTIRFTLLWLVATMLHALLEHLTASRSTAATISAIPLVLGLAGLAWWAGRDLLGRFGRTTIAPPMRKGLASLQPPSLSAMRQALHGSHRPVLFHWIPLGALTTTGVMLTTVTAAIWTGHRLGLDFAAIDRAESSASAAAPLLLLACSVLVAFPVSGFLVARASNSDGVLEPALSAAMAIVAVLVLLGLAAPVALVLALAFAPVAFALACGGAWVGLGR
jgi:RsiW-degrading membrane proteinase PrsW (M82 family)